MIKSYQDLLVWQKAHKLVLSIYKVSAQFPQEERFGIVQQLRKAAYSIPANISEGCERSTKEFIQFTTIAKGSLNETKYFLLLAKHLGFLKQEMYSDLDKQSNEVGKMLSGLINSLRNKKKKNVIY